jgi:hypothetical protein
MSSSQITALALVIPMTLLGAWAATAPASNGDGGPVAHASKKKGCKSKKKGSKSASAAKKKKKKKCKPAAKGGPPLSVTINCPTGVVSGSSTATISGTAAVTGAPVILYYARHSYYKVINAGGLHTATYGNTEFPTAEIYPSSSGAWSFSFTPNLNAYEPPPPNQVTPDPHGGEWETGATAQNYYPDYHSDAAGHDSAEATCRWTAGP